MALRTRRVKKSRMVSGGFIPSIMGPFAQNAAVLTPLVIASGYRLIHNKSTKTKQVRKKRVQTRSKAKYRRRR